MNETVPMLLAGRRNAMFRRPGLRTVSVAVAVMVFGPAAIGAPGGELDSTFGGTGRVLLPGSHGYVIAQQAADGGLLVGGSVSDAAGTADFAVWRFNGDGSIDDSFGDHGLAAIDFAAGDDVLTSLLLTAAGKVIAVGTTYSTEPSLATEFALARLSPDGTLDEAFGDAGRVTLHPPGSLNNLTAAVLDAAERIVVSAEGRPSFAGTDAVFARFNSDGSLDTTFGAGPVPGFTVVDSGLMDVPGKLVRQADGKYLSCGSYWAPSAGPVGGEPFFMQAIRLNEDGSIDAAFGAGGVWQVDSSRLPDSVTTDCVELPDGGIVLVGYEYWIEQSSLVRLRTDGALDTGHWDLGMTPLGDRLSIVSALIVMQDGDLAMAGTANSRVTEARGTAGVTESDLFFARIDPETGQLVADFGDLGITLVDVGQGNTAASARTSSSGLLQQADGKLVAAGGIMYRGTDGQTDVIDALVLARADPRGAGSAGLIGFRSAAIRVDEGGTNAELGALTEAVISVQRTGGSAGSISVDYATFADTATRADFIASAGTLTWMSGETGTKFISVLLVDDQLVETEERLGLELSNATAPVTRSGASVFIFDDDTQAASPSSSTGANARRGGGGAFDLATVLLIILAGLLTRRDRFSVPQRSWPASRGPRLRRSEPRRLSNQLRPSAEPRPIADHRAAVQTRLCTSMN